MKEALANGYREAEKVVFYQEIPQQGYNQISITTKKGR